MMIDNQKISNELILKLNSRIGYELVSGAMDFELNSELNFLLRSKLNTGIYVNLSSLINNQLKTLV